MSAVLFLITLVIAIAILVVLIMKVKLHPTFALFLVGLGMALVNGFPFMEAMGLLTKGFGNTLGSLGIPIMLGAILAMGVQDTGAAKAIANFFIRLFHGKNLELAPALTAYVVSIPVFGDITTILCSNIANVLSKRKHISMSTMASFTQTGLNLTHAMVPPHARHPGCVCRSKRRPGHGYHLGYCHHCDRLLPDLAGPEEVV